MTYVTVEDTSWPVDDIEVQWMLRYDPRSLTSAQEVLAADILEAYDGLTSPLIDDEEAHEQLRLARAGVAHWKTQHDEDMRAAVAKEWVVEATDINHPDDSWLLGPYSRAEAEDKATEEHKRNPDIKTVLRKTMT